MLNKFTNSPMNISGENWYLRMDKAMADKNARNQAPDYTTVVDISGGKKGVSKKQVDKVKTPKKKRKKKLLLFIIIFVLLVLIAAFLTAHLYFDFFGWKEPMFEIMHNLDPDYKDIGDREAALIDKESDLEQQELALTEREDAVLLKELANNKRETELNDLEKSRVPVYRPPINETDREYMEGIAKIYANMEPENAASVMNNLYTLEDMAGIIYFMSAAKAAAILECMTPSRAAQITDHLINVYP